MGNYKTWHWQEFHSWKETAWELMVDVLTPAVIEQFKRTPPEYIVGDDLSWLDEIVESTSGYIIDSQDILAHRISTHYHALRAFHGSRPTNKDSFYNEGIRPLDPEYFEKRAHELFLDGSFSELSAESIKAGIARVGREYREGLLYFEANEAHLTEFCAHYMLYGSEYLCSIAASLPGTRDYRQHLKKFGTPTIFECDVPISLIDYGLLKEFAGAALESMFSVLVDPAFEHAGKWRGSGFYIRQSLSPQYILGHKVPTVLKDPLLGYRPVRTGHSTDPDTLIE